MQLKPTERRDLRNSYKRIGWFILGVFLIDAFIAFLIYRADPNFSGFLCGLIIVSITTIFYLIYLWVLKKLDARKKQKIEKSGKKDPFSYK